MMGPFLPDLPISGLSEPFPGSEELCAVLQGRPRVEQEIFTRLWLSEGIPYAFQSCPAVFEYIRGWLGQVLDVHPKEITLIGSARIGYSLAPLPKFGSKFSQKSDLDFSVISSSLFQRLIRDSHLFSKDYRNARIQPRNKRERDFWDANLKLFTRNIRKGFLDSKKIPNYAHYPTAQTINETMWLLVERLKVTANAPTIQKASIRTYQNWESFVNQVSLNLHSTMNKL